MRESQGPVATSQIRKVHDVLSLNTTLEKIATITNPVSQIPIP